MSDDQEQLKRHWQELAEQLGLESPDAPGAEESAAPPTEDTTRELSDAPNAHSSIESMERSEAQNQSPASTDRVDESVPAPASDQFVSAAEASADSAWTPEETSPEESSPPEARPRRGRRTDRTSAERSPRRGRGGSRRRPDIAFPAEIESEPAEVEDQEPAASESAEEFEPHVLEEPSGPQREEEPDDLDTLSDWNVPSWEELIASLYRPER